MKFLILLFLISLTSCIDESDENTISLINLKIDTFNLVETRASYNLTEIILCLDKMRIKKIENEEVSSEDHHPGQRYLDIKRIELKPEGTNLGKFKITEGIYFQVELDFVAECKPEVEHAFRFKNLNGEFNTKKTFTLVFKGEVEITTKETTLLLNISKYLDQFETVTNSDQLENIFKDYNGTFE